MEKYKSIVISIFMICGLCGCEKYLDEKPRQSLVVPSTLSDLEALLNNQNVVSTSGALNELVADNYYVDTEDWEMLLSQAGRLPTYYDQCMNYIWDPQAVHSSWNDAYKSSIYYTNVVLDVLKEIQHHEPDRANSIEGAALFIRAFIWERLAQVYAKPYSSATPDDLGLVLRTTSDINIVPVRATVQETYAQIINDLTRAANLLPVQTPYPSQPNKAAAYAALARTFLSMREYEQARAFADSCLNLRAELIDFNTVDSTAMPVFQEYNAEVIFHSNSSAGILSGSRAKIPQELLALYDTNDLRRKLFFQANVGEAEGTYRYRGNYLGRFNPAGDFIFDGLTTSEVYLIRSECRVRSGDLQGAIDDLNTLMRNRLTNHTGLPSLENSSADELLKVVLTERRKELVFRGQRWTDLRRLNEEGWGIELTRNLGGKTYTLPAGDNRWVLLLPHEPIIYSGLTQNPR